jgi:ubiquinone/menaquinone biosynthesis C-methylase UbiE
MNDQLLYRDLAPYYDLIYAAKEYEKEAERIIDLIAKYKRSAGNELLDVGCGTGRHLQYFTNTFSCTGADCSEEILTVARKNVSNVEFIQADMVTMDLQRSYDVITCLFGSIGYVKTAVNLQKTLQNFARHLVTGGIAIIEPWLTPAIYCVGSPHMETYDGENIKIARLNVSQKKGTLSILDMHYLIAETGNPVRHVVDHHELGLFTEEATMRYMTAAGFSPTLLKEGRGIYIGVKQ